MERSGEKMLETTDEEVHAEALEDAVQELEQEQDEDFFIDPEYAVYLHEDLKQSVDALDSLWWKNSPLIGISSVITGYGLENQNDPQSVIPIVAGALGMFGSAGCGMAMIQAGSSRESQIEEMEEILTARVLDESYAEDLSSLVAESDAVRTDFSLDKHNGESAADAYDDILDEYQAAYAILRGDIDDYFPEETATKFRKYADEHGKEKLLSKMFSDQEAAKLQEIDETDPIQHVLQIRETSDDTPTDARYKLTVYAGDEEVATFAGENEAATEYLNEGEDLLEYDIDSWFGPEPDGNVKISPSMTLNNLKEQLTAAKQKYS